MRQAVILSGAKDLCSSIRKNPPSDPLTRPAPADESAGAGHPLAQGGGGKMNSRLRAWRHSNRITTSATPDFPLRSFAWTVSPSLAACISAPVAFDSLKVRPAV
jgi:hypothetical protein